MIVFAQFGIRAAKLDPEAISELLDMQPSRSFARGDKYIGHVSKTKMGVRSRPWGVWAVSTEGVVHSDNPKDHVDYLVRLLEPKRTAIETLLSDEELYIDVRLWIESEESVHGACIRSESLAILCSMCRDINISVIGGSAAKTPEQ